METLELKIAINTLVIVSFEGIVTQNSIVDLARTVEGTLLDLNEDETKIRSIFEVIIEIMQNILNYSSESICISDDVYRSKGSILITLDQTSKTYSITASNLVNTENQMKIIESLDGLNNLSLEELREIYKERRRSRRKNHDRGAGLGFLDIIRKSKNALIYEFTKDTQDNIVFTVKVTIN